MLTEQKVVYFGGNSTIEWNFITDTIKNLVYQGDKVTIFKQDDKFVIHHEPLSDTCDCACENKCECNNPKTSPEENTGVLRDKNDYNDSEVISVEKEPIFLNKLASTEILPKEDYME